MLLDKQALISEEFWLHQTCVIAELMSLALICSMLLPRLKDILLSSVLCMPIDLLKLSDCLIALNVVVMPKS